MIEIFAVADTLITAVIVTCGSILTAFVVGYQTMRSTREDYARQDEVASRAKTVADNAARETAAVAATAREAASLLLEAQAATTANTEQVARLAANKSSSKGTAIDTGMRALVISYPNGARREIFLNGTPNEGHHILLQNTPIDGQPFRVAKVLWIEATKDTDPSVILVVVSSDDSLDRRTEEIKDLMSIAKREIA